MRVSFLGALTVPLLILATAPTPARAQFGLPGGLPRIDRLPVPDRLFRRALPHVHFHKFRRKFGLFGAVGVGSVILGRLSVRDGEEVTRRSRVVLDKSSEEEVTDTYRSKDGAGQITITAGPVRKASDLKDDPALRTTADTVRQANEAEGKSKSKGKGKGDSETGAQVNVVSIGSLPADTSCRRLTTAMEGKAETKKAGKAKKEKVEKVETAQKVDDADKTEAVEKKTETVENKTADIKNADNKSVNVSIMCQTDGDWKPAST
jgi:hypothetical protein